MSGESVARPTNSANHFLLRGVMGDGITSEFTRGLRMIAVRGFQTGLRLAAVASSVSLLVAYVYHRSGGQYFRVAVGAGTTERQGEIPSRSLTVGGMPRPSERGTTWGRGERGLTLDGGSITLWSGESGKSHSVDREVIAAFAKDGASAAHANVPGNAIGPSPPWTLETPGFQYLTPRFVYSPFVDAPGAWGGVSQIPREHMPPMRYRRSEALPGSKSGGIEILEYDLEWRP